MKFKTRRQTKRRVLQFLLFAMNRLLLTAALFLGGCTPQTVERQASAQTPTAPAIQQQSAEQIRQLSYQVVQSFPHDTDAFTQGLLWHNGYLYESTGLEGKSRLRKVDFETGKVLQQYNLPAQYFGEGIVVFDEKFYYITYKSQVGVVIDAKTFKPLSRFTYKGEGWGLTTDGKRLLQSNGSSDLIWRDPKDFSEVGRIKVTRYGEPLTNLNELEWIEGKVWANVWLTNTIVVIDPKTGKVESELDLTGLANMIPKTGNEDVLNGIAYEPKSKRIFVTGKNWPKLFWIKVD
jgi:glutamine cyclotransferase